MAHVDIEADPGQGPGLEWHDLVRLYRLTLADDEDAATTWARFTRTKAGRGLAELVFEITLGQSAFTAEEIERLPDEALRHELREMAKLAKNLIILGCDDDIPDDVNTGEVWH